MTETTSPDRLALWRPYLPHGAAILLSFACFALLKETGWITGRRHLLHPGILTLLVLALLPLRARDFAPALLILTRTIVALFTLYAVAAYPAVDQEWLARAPYAEALIMQGRWMALAAGILSWWRPGLGLIPLLFVTWKKHILGDMFGFRLNATDYYIVAELGILLIIGMGVIALIRWLDLWRAERAAAAWSLSETLFFAGFALHLANYFHSAVAKMTLPGAAPWTWVIENETHNIMMATAMIGLGPLQGHPGLAALSQSVMHIAQWPLNVFTLLIQLAAIAGVLRLRWGVVLTVVYDIMHLGIFLTTGILFWKWMTVNIALVGALGTLKGRPLPPPVIAIGVLTVLFSPSGFRIAELGWYDSPNLNLPRVEAVLEDGRHVPVPTNFFLEGSAEIAKSGFADEFSGHWQDVQAFGKVGALETLHAAERCALPLADRSGLARSFDDPKPAAYLRQHHAFILAHVDDEGRYPYNWFPHHNWSNPRLFRDFAALDLRQIAAYRYVVESVCFSYDKGGGIARDVRLRGTHVIDLP